MFDDIYNTLKNQRYGAGLDTPSQNPFGKFSQGVAQAVTHPMETFAPTTGTIPEAISRGLPFAGEAWTADDVKKSIAENQYGSAALMTGLGLLPLGGYMAGAIRQGAKNVPGMFGQSGAIVGGRESENVVDFLSKKEELIRKEKANTLRDIFAPESRISKGTIRETIVKRIDPFMEGHVKLNPGTRILTKEGKVGKVVDNLYQTFPSDDMGKTYKKLYEDIWRDYWNKDSENLIARMNNKPEPHKLNRDEYDKRFKNAVKNNEEKINNERWSDAYGKYTPKIVYEDTPNMKPKTIFPSEIDKLYGIRKELPELSLQDTTYEPPLFPDTTR